MGKIEQPSRTIMGVGTIYCSRANLKVTGDDVQEHLDEKRMKGGNTEDAG